MRRCMRRHAQQQRTASQALQACRNSSAWESFSPANLTLVHSVADRSTGTSRMVRALSSNLAATDSKSSWADGNRGSSPYASQVATLALDDLLEDLDPAIDLEHDVVITEDATVPPPRCEGVGGAAYMYAPRGNFSVGALESRCWATGLPCSQHIVDGMLTTRAAL